MKRTRYTVLLLVFLHFFFDGNTQKIVYSDHVQFRNFSVNDGLSQNTVNCIQQDSLGYLWFGTRAGGLNRFDGYSFKHYNRNIYGSSILNSDEIICMDEGNARDLYFGTEDAGIYVLDRSSNSIRHFYLEESALCMFFERNRSTLWVGTANGLVLKSTFVKGNEGGVRLIDNETVTSISSNDDDEIYVSTNKYQYTFNPDAQLTGKIRLSDLSSPGSASNMYSCIDTSQNIWLVNDTGLWRISKTDRNNTQNHFLFQDIPGFRDVLIRSIICDRNNQLWIGTSKGLICYHELKEEISIYRKQSNKPNSLTHNSVYSLFEDREGNIWVGTWSGISLLSEKLVKFEHIRHVNFLSSSLSNNMVSSFAEGKNGIWIGTEQGGLNFYNRHTQSFHHYTYGKNQLPVAQDHIKCLYVDSRKDLWIGTFGAGIRKRKYSGGKETGFLTNDRVFDLTEFPKDTLWVGTISGLLKMDLSGNIIREYSTDTIKPGSLHNNFITCLYTSNSSELWVGTRKGGVALYMPEIDDFRVFRKEDKEQGLESDYIICITEDREGTLWIGTDFGLYFLDREAGSFKKAEYLKGLQNFLINGIVFDTRNNVWISTNNGIFTYDNQLQTLHKFKLSDGMQSFEFNRGAYYFSEAGDIYFGGINGYNIIDPERIHLNESHTVPVIQSVKTINGTMNLENQAEAEIRLKHDQNDLEIECVALSFIHAEDNLYSYILEGYNEEWSTPSKNRTLTYTNLSPGDYEFILKVSNNDEIWNDQTSNIHIIIKPPFWATGWAYAAYVIILGIILFFIRRALLTRQKQKLQLEYERNQKKQIQELNEMKLRYFTNISHEFRTPLTLIKGPLTDLEKRLVKDEETKSMLNVISRNTNRLLNLINQLLDFRKVEKDMIEPSIAEGKLEAFINEIVSDFEHQAKERGIELHFRTEDSRPDEQQYFDPYILDKIIFNLLSNALKFTPPAGKIDVILTFNKDWARLDVEDNGEGIAAKDLEKVFDRFYSSKNLMKHNFSGSGIGLALSKRLIEIHQGSISVESEVGKGTCFSISFPSDRRAYDSLMETTRGSHLIEANDIELTEQPKVRSEAIDKNHTVLVVEDNAELRQYLHKTFKTYCKVKTAENGEEALKLARTESIDIIISDIMMPKMDGIELSKILHTDMATSHIPIIFLTAKSGDENTSLGLETGAIDYITKPFNPGDLVSKVNNILNNRSQVFKKLVSAADSARTQDKILSLDEKFLKQIFDSIQQNYHMPGFKVESLGEVVHLSRSQLHRKFKSLTGKTISDTLIDIRLCKAMELIQTKSLSISEVAFQTGYNNLSVFSAAFKKKFGINPSEVESP